MACVPSPLAKQILAEASEIAPGRSRASDGICGDAAHQTRKSYHNSGDAADTTHDPGRGFDAHGHAETVRIRCETGQERRVDQIISNGRIATSARQYGLVGRRWQWRRYTGPNPHRTHAHYSLNTRSSGARFFAAPEIEHPALPEDTKETDPMAATRLIKVKGKPGPAAIVSWDGSGKTVQQLASTDAANALAVWSAAGIPTLEVDKAVFDDIVGGKAKTV